MALYAIGDLHLSYGVPAYNQARFGRSWENHEEKIKRNWLRLVQPSDTVVLAGDHTWGKTMAECAPDFDWIAALPGRKILLRGNHDMFWDVKKTEKLNAQFKGTFAFLQNNYYVYHCAATGTDYALVGTKGYCFEGKDTIEHSEMLVGREMKRLEESFRKAYAAGYRKFIMFLHYPPTNLWQDESRFTKIAEDYHVDQVVYAHCHGYMRFHDSYRGQFHGIEYSLVSADCLRFRPKKILD